MSGGAGPRTILHVDMDAFYAAVEQRDRPELAGKPVIVGADPKGGRGRGVVSTASYEARRFGVSSAMPISTAYRLCPQGVYVPVDMDKYLAVSGEVMAILGRASDLVEPVSIDEAFLDVTGSRRALGSGEEIARRVKEEIRRTTALAASVAPGAVTGPPRLRHHPPQGPDGTASLPPHEGRPVGTMAQGCPFVWRSVNEANGSGAPCRYSVCPVARRTVVLSVY